MALDPLPLPHQKLRTSLRLRSGHEKPRINRTITAAANARLTSQIQGCTKVAEAEEGDAEVMTISDIRRAIWEEQSTCE